MNTGTNPDTGALVIESGASSRRIVWRDAGLAFAVAVVALVLVNREALSSWVKLWAFAGQEYGFVVVATSSWLFWRCRRRIEELAPRPDWRGLLLVAPLGVGLGLAYMVDIRVAQFALFLLSIGALIWTILGPAIFRVVAYPMAFLFLTLPVWSYLEPVLQEMTVRATVIALNITGLPVFVDETYIQIPGRTIVVLARCSGSQFFQAGVILGALYVYLNFRVLWLRVLVLTAFVVMAILGNWIRVYLLVFLPLLTGQQHFMFGWAVFAAVLIPTLWLCMRLQRYEDNLLLRIDSANERSDMGKRTTEPARSTSARVIGIALAATLLLVMGTIVPNWLTTSIQAPVTESNPITVRSPWSGPYAASTDWRPSYGQADTEAMAAYRVEEDGEVTSYWAYYQAQQQGAEVINELNTVYNAARWQPRGGYAGSDYSEVPIENGHSLSVIETRLENVETGEERLVWHWYHVGGRNVVQPWRAKLAQIIGLAKGRPDATVIALSTDVNDIGEARSLLRSFVTANVDGADDY